MSIDDNINASYDGSRKLDEIVFEHRNKEYGAYNLRKSYRPILTKSFFIGIALCLFSVLTPLIYFKIKEKKQKEETKVSVDLTDIKELPPPPEEEKELPPPPPPMPVEPPKQEIVKDMIPEPKPNPKVEEPPKKIEEVKETTIGTVNQEGEKIKSYTPPPPPPSTGTGKAVETPRPTNEIVDSVDQEAVFGGGIDKFRNLFQSNFDNESVEGEGTLKTMVTFVVERDGSLSNIKASGPNSDFNREAERTVRSIKGKWTPGKVNGEPVRSRFRFPVTMNFE